MAVDRRVAGAEGFCGLRGLGFVFRALGPR